MKKIVTSIIIVIGILYLGFSAIYYKLKNNELHDKIEFYEKVITDFGIEEFINYPDLYYEDGYIDQVKVHQCMWAIQDNCEE